MTTDNRCVAESARSLPNGCRRSTTGTAFGCVDWFLYDPGPHSPVARSQERDPETGEAWRRPMTASEERQLMGYVR